MSRVDKEIAHLCIQARNRDCAVMVVMRDARDREDRWRYEAFPASGGKVAVSMIRKWAVAEKLTWSGPDGFPMITISCRSARG